jgi:hypothetical protein
MSSKEHRSNRRPFTFAGRSVCALSRSAGRARGVYASLDTLEARVLLSGDHPSWDPGFDPDNPPAATVIVLDGEGEGSDTGEITTGDDDLFRFTAPASDFVTIRADTITGGSGLDSRLELYSDGGVLLASASGDGTLTGGTPTDAWIGFVAEAGRDYYARVMADGGSSGGYAVRVDAMTTDLTISNGVAWAQGSVDIAGDDNVFRLTTGGDASFDALAYALPATLTPDTVDTRVDVYDESGGLVFGDSESGRLNDAFGVWRSSANGTFYVRVRSDDFTPGSATATGEYGLTVDPQVVGADRIDIDAVTRRAFFGDSLSSGQDADLFAFEAQGTGRTIIYAVGSGASPLPDPLLRLYDGDGNLIAINDDILFGDPSLSAEVSAELVGGETYYAVVEAFDVADGGSYTLSVESHHTFDLADPIDDHADSGDYANATPILWGDPEARREDQSDPTSPVIDDHAQVVVAMATGRIHLNNETDLFTFSVPTDMLGEYGGNDDGGDPAAWLGNGRPSSRLSLRLMPTDGFGLLQMTVRIYDSNHEVIYENATIAPPLQEPTGSFDPAANDPGVDQEMIGPELWGGETYYLEVVGTSARGRYTMQLIADAAEDTFAPINELTGEGDFNNARELQIIQDRGWAVSRDLPRGTLQSRLYEGIPDDDIAAVQQWMDGELISTIGDKDLFFFRAHDTGSAEVWINTTDMPDRYLEQHLDADGNQLAGFEKTKTFSSLFDSAVRIYNADFQQIAYNDDSGVVGGEAVTLPFVAPLEAKSFQRRDARAVFNVEAGETYFILVESGQRYKAGAAASDPSARTLAGEGEIDWRHALGAYEVVINTLPIRDFGSRPLDDDHVNEDEVGLLTATPVPVDPDTGLGSVAGEIKHTGENPVDTDLFEFMSPSNGALTVTVRAVDGSGVMPRFFIGDSAVNLVAEATSDAGGVARVTFEPVLGERYVLSVAGGAGTEGRYVVEIEATGRVDDHAQGYQLSRASALEILDFRGTGRGEGVIEAAGDSDLFTFRAADFDEVTLTVSSSSATLRPDVAVYEIGEDPDGSPVLLRIAFDTDASAGGEAVVTFSTSPDRPYYVVVSGEANNSGAYEVDLEMKRTDDHADAGQEANATFIVTDSATGRGTESGVVERAGDTDLFSYISPAGGPGTVAVSASEAGFSPRVSVFDANGALVASAADNGTGLAVASFVGVRSARYFVLVSGDGTTGGYGVSVTAPAIDDHANVTEWDLATRLELSDETGDALASGEVDPIGDSDLFTFESRVEGTIDVTLTPAGLIRAWVRVYDADRALVGEGSGADAGEAVRVSVDAGGEGEVHYVVVSALPVPGGSLTGEYALAVDGPVPPPPGVDDDHADAGDFANATVVGLSGLDGDGSVSGEIDVADDTDLFTFVNAGRGRLRLELDAPAGSRLNAGLRVYDGGGGLILTDTTGHAGAIAAADLEATPGERYYVEIMGLGAATGGYTLRVDAAPETHVLYYPEGYAAGSISEFASIANPNDYAVSYTVKLYYEIGELEQTIASGVIGAGARGGVTLSDRFAGGALGAVRPDTPYAIVIESDGPLGATLSHYDFGIATGEAFTGVVSDAWSFSEGHRLPGEAFDFLVYYNPNPTDVIVELTAYADGRTPVTVRQTVGAHRRFGFNFNETEKLPLGEFGFVVTSRAADPADAHVGIVAALSHFDTSAGAGFGLLGDAGGGSRAGIVTSLTDVDGAPGEVSILNANGSAVAVRISGTYLAGGLPALTRFVTVPAHATVRLDGEALGLISGQAIGLRYDADAPVTVTASSERNEDADAAAAVTAVTGAYYFGDGFMNAELAGTVYTETLSLFNPGPDSLAVEVRLLFSDLTSARRGSPELAGPDGVLELADGLGLDLADALAGDLEDAADLFEGVGVAVADAVAELDDLALAVGQRLEHLLDALRSISCAAVSTGASAVVLDEVAEVAVLALADRAVERDRVAADLHDAPGLGDGHLGDRSAISSMVGSRPSLLQHSWRCCAACSSSRSCAPGCGWCGRGRRWRG